MTDLQQRLHHTLDGQRTDLARLSARAQRQGLRIRRRRRLTTATGSVALVATLGAGVAGVTDLIGPTPDATGTRFATDGPASSGLGEATAPATARSVTAALRAAVLDVAEGVGSDFAGFHEHAGSSRTHDPLDGSPERDTFSGSFTFAPADGTGAATVRATVADAAGLDHDQRTAEENFASCSPVEEGCQVTPLSDGSLLKTFLSRSAATGGAEEGAVEAVATRLVDGAVVTVAAGNFRGEVTAAGSQVTRSGPVLTLAQLTDVVSLPWWGYDLPREHAEAGAALASYREDDSEVD